MNAGIFRALVTCCLLVPAGVEAGQAGDLLSVQDLKKLDLVQLLKLQVTTVSRHREAASRAAAAVEVIPQQQIERTGAASVPDALRMATGVQVSRFGGHSFAISSRGFTSLAANKLQVMQDGQSLYSPLFSGVFWDAYGVMLEDLDRIEVIRGPGATMWGANAVNGVINIITKDARETQGTLMAGGGGSEERAFGVLRHGGKLGERAFYRMYGRYHGRDDMARSDGGGTHDGSKEGQGGVRLDAGLANEDRLTFQSDYLYSEFDTSLRTKAINRSSNVIGRWTHQFASDSDLQLQTYYRRFERNVPEQFGEERNTYDLDLQGRKLVGGRHDLIGGVNCRLSGDKTKTGGTTEFVPRNKTIGVYSLFLQDEVSLLDRRLALVVGSKFEWQSLDGFEPQPSVRLAWTPSDRQTVWSAFSRAARMPSRIDEDLRLVPAPGSGVVAFRYPTSEIACPTSITS